MKLMYDNDKLQRSEVYFSLLQLLRIFSEWITSSRADLGKLVEASRNDLRYYSTTHMPEQFRSEPRHKERPDGCRESDIMELGHRSRSAPEGMRDAACEYQSQDQRDQELTG